MDKEGFVLRGECDDGATAVEYAIMVAAIAAVIIGIVTTLGGQVSVLFDNAVAAFSAVGS